MLPTLLKLSNLKFFLLSITFVFSLQVIFFSFSVKAQISQCNAQGRPVSITQPKEDSTVRGTTQITLSGDEPPLIPKPMWVNIGAFNNNEWKEIWGGMSGGGSPQENYPWNTTKFSNGSWKLKAHIWYEDSTSGESECVEVTVNNPPPPPPDRDGDGVPDSSDACPNQPGPASNGGCPLPPPQSSNQSSSQQPSTTTTTTQPASEPAPTTLVSQDQIVIEEEIPVTVSAFDPDIFLKGVSVKLENVKTIKKDNKTLLHFDGTARPNTLVTLYIFSNPVIVTVKSDGGGFWYYDRDKGLEGGKHIAFATIYDEGVTRRSNVVDFFVTKSATGGASLIIKKSNLGQLVSYGLILGGAITIALLTLIVYRIYSRKRVASGL